MPKKLTLEEVKQRFIKKGLMPLFKKYNRNNEKLLCQDSMGYKYFISLLSLNTNKLSAFGNGNPYTIENIKLWIKLNDKNYELLSKEFKGTHKKLKCKCKICNHEWKVTWGKLLQGRDCPKCNGKNRLTIKYVKNELQKINPNIEILSNAYKNNVSKIKCRCLIDGHIWYATWSNLQRGQGCPKCYGNIRLTIDEVKQKLKKINKDIIIKSDYYKNNKTKLDCKCMVCNHEWETNWSNLSQGQGCPKCANKSLEGLYNLALAKRNKKEWESRKALVYFVKCWDKHEEFYKIGITVQNIKNRFSGLPYNYEILKTINTNLYEAIKLEKQLHELHDQYSYIPLKKFGGYTECFTKLDLNTIVNKAS